MGILTKLGLVVLSLAAPTAWGLLTEWIFHRFRHYEDEIDHTPTLD